MVVCHLWNRCPYGSHGSDECFGRSGEESVILGVSAGNLSTPPYRYSYKYDDNPGDESPGKPSPTRGVPAPTQIMPVTSAQTLSCAQSSHRRRLMDFVSRRTRWRSIASMVVGNVSPVITELSSGHGTQRSRQSAQIHNRALALVARTSTPGETKNDGPHTWGP